MRNALTLLPLALIRIEVPERSVGRGKPACTNALGPMLVPKTAKIEPWAIDDPGKGETM